MMTIKKLLLILGAALLCCSSPVLPAPPSLTIDLADEDTADTTSPNGVQNRIKRVFGADGNGAVGVPVAGGFDCDGDGHLDTAFAQIQANPLSRTRAGQITLVFGDGTIGGQADSAGFPADMLKIIGDQENEVAGAEIWMDDLDADGLGDLIIGRQNYTPGPGRDGAGALTILFGNATWRTTAQAGEVLDLRSLPAGQRVFNLFGRAAFDRVGIWMRTGDVDGDGIAEVAVGADQEDLDGGANTVNNGAAYLLRGGAHLVPAGMLTNTVDLAAFGTPAFASHPVAGHLACIRPPAVSANWHFGATVQLGDLDGNGRAELLIAATLNRAGALLTIPSPPPGTYQSSGGAPKGRAAIAWDENFPGTLWPLDYTFAIDAPPLGQTSMLIGDAVINDSFGEELLAGRDYSGDGAPDLFVGDIVGDGPNGANAGVGHVFYNPSNLRGRTIDLSTAATNDPDVVFSVIHGPVAGAIGADTVAHGDFDGDGIWDLAFGNPHDNPEGRGNAGSVHVLFGQPGGWPALINLNPATLPGPEEIRITLVQGAIGASGSDFGDTLCYSASSADLDRDGRTDFILNEMTGNGFGGAPLNVGNLLVISGPALTPTNTLPTSLSASPAELGFGLFDIDNLGANTSSLTLTLRNTSAAPQLLSSAALAGPGTNVFTLVNPPVFPLALAANASVSLTVQYRPDLVPETGFYGAAVVVGINNEPIPFRVPITGTAVRSAQPILAGLDLIPASNPIGRVRTSGSQLGFMYQLESTTSLLPSPQVWTDLGSAAFGTGGPLMLSTPSSNEPLRLFRIRRF